MSTSSTSEQCGERSTHSNHCGLCEPCLCCNEKLPDTRIWCIRCGKCPKCKKGDDVDVVVDCDFCTKCNTYSQRYWNSMYDGSEKGAPLCFDCYSRCSELEKGVCLRCQGHTPTQINLRGPYKPEGVSAVCSDCGGFIVNGKCQGVDSTACPIPVSTTKKIQKRGGKLPKTVGRNPNRR